MQAQNSTLTKGHRPSCSYPSSKTHGDISKLCKLYIREALGVRSGHVLNKLFFKVGPEVSL